MATGTPEYLQRLLGRYDADRMSAALNGEKAIESEIITVDGVEAKFAELDRRVESRINRLRESDKSKSAKEQAWRPYIGRDTLNERLMALLQRHHLNSKIIVDLWRHLAEHVALEKHMESAIREIRGLMGDKESEIPKTMLAFAQKLKAEGLNTNAIQHMSKADMRALVAFLNNRKSPEGAAALTTLARGPGKSHEQRFEESERDRDELREEVGSRPVVPRPDPVPERAEPVIPQGYPARWERLMGDMPADYWSSVTDFGGRYVTDYAIDETDGAATVRRMPLPGADEWNDLREIDEVFAQATTQGVPSKNSTGARLRSYFAGTMRMAEDEVPEEWVKAWMLLLYARHIEDDEFNRKFGMDYFVGVRIPCPATGSHMVRTIRRNL